MLQGGTHGLCEPTLEQYQIKWTKVFRVYAHILIVVICFFIPHILSLQMAVEQISPVTPDEPNSTSPLEETEEPLAFPDVSLLSRPICYFHYACRHL